MFVDVHHLSPPLHQLYSSSQANVAHLAGPDIEVVELVITRDSTKTDKDGAGHNFSFPRDTDTVADAAFDLVQDMFDWAKVAKPKQEDPFFAYRGEWALKYDQVNNTIKKVMSSLGFTTNLHQFSTHSLRIGDASLLAQAGFADCIIQKMGHWKSLCFLEYIRLSTTAFRNCYKQLTNHKILTNNDVTKLMPNFARGQINDSTVITPPSK